MATRSRGGLRAAQQDTIPIRGTGVTAPIRAAMDRPLVISAYRFPLFVGAVHLIIVQLAASLAFRFGTATGPSGPANYVEKNLNGIAETIVGPMRLWDGLWYTMIAEQGYGNWTPKAAFWPLFPWSMRLLSDLTGMAPEVAGYLIANVCFVVALIFLYRLVAIEFDVRIARRTLWALALFPTSLFFSAVYTESPFLMLSVGALLAARLRYWWIAGLLGALAALTRSYGVFLVLPFALLFVQQYGVYLRDLLPKGVTVGMPALGPAIFGWHLERVQNSWKAFIDVQNQWNRTSATPWETLGCGIQGCVLTLTQYGRTRDWTVDGADWSWLRQLRDHPTWSLVTSQTWRKSVADGDTLELVCTLGFIAIALIGLWKLPLYQSAYLIPGLLIPLLSPSTVHPLMSMPRFGLTLFPIFIVLAMILRPRVIAIPAAVFSTALLVLLTIQFANWYWVS
ncbi:MAG: hypothetical protein QOG89_1156 [Thermomicrobiales bacterium]|nr:hypothetical protein [Thermomicrobiales bacterium]